MLVLSRELDEKLSVFIAKGTPRERRISLKISEIRGSKVCLAIVAPRNLVILRSEIYDEQVAIQDLLSDRRVSSDDVGALVLTRKQGDSIMVVGSDDGQDVKITFTVIAVGRKNVRVGIQAPKDYTVLRDEVMDRCA